MKNKTPISKDHTEEIWMALLTMVEHSQKNIFESDEKSEMSSRAKNDMDEI